MRQCKVLCFVTKNGLKIWQLILISRNIGETELKSFLNNIFCCCCLDVISYQEDVEFRKTWSPRCRLNQVFFALIGKMSIFTIFFLTFGIFGPDLTWLHLEKLGIFVKLLGDFKVNVQENSLISIKMLQITQKDDRSW